MTDPSVTPELFLFRDSESVYLARSIEHATELRTEATGYLPEYLNDPFELMPDMEAFTVTSEEPFEDPREELVDKPFKFWKLTTTVLEWRTNSAIGPTEIGEWVGPA